MSLKTQDWRCWCSWLVMGSVLITFLQERVFAQIAPDNTLPNNSSVTRDRNTFNITRGTQAGRNLFHSFSEFSVPTGGTAFFNNALDIQNIISRVTGGSVSNIDGLIRANGTANLFLINPSGIVFGPSSSLNVGGSFVASTASSLKFADGFEFSAATPQTTPLLTISVPIGLQFGENPGSIQVQGSGNHYSQDPQINADGNIVGTTFNRSTRPVGLQVQPDKTLALVGGDVALKGGNLTAPEGQIELGSVVANGFVSLNPVDKGWSLGYIGVKTFGNIQLSQAASVDASGAGGGDIQVRSRHVALTDGSAIVASTLEAKPGGTLTLVADDAVELTGTDPNHQIFSGLITESLGSGRAGDITISTGKLIARDGAQVTSSSFKEGAAGKLTVTASESIELVASADVTFNKLGSVTIPGGLFTRSLSGPTGDGGDLTINTRQLFVRDGAQVGTGTFGAGKGGNLSVTADTVEVTGTSADGETRSGLFTQVDRGSAGNAGDLTINTQQLFVRNGAVVSASTFGAGKGGNLSVTADTVEVTGTSADGEIVSGLSTLANPGSTGDAGDLTINTRQLFVRDGAQVSAGTFGAGKGRNLNVTADTVEVTGTSADGEISSGLFTQADRGSAGNAGDLTINTRQLFVRDGALVSASTLGTGKGGNFNVTADIVEVTGTTADGQFPSALSASADPGPTGNAGDLTINTRQLLVGDGAVVSAGTFGAGKGGNLNVTADTVEVIGTSADGQFFSGLFTQASPSATGMPGDLTINAQQLFVRYGAQIDASTFGTSKGGNLNVTADTVELTGTSADGQFSSGLFTQAGRGSAGNAGDLTINTQQLLVRNGAQITAATFGAGKGGNLNVTADTVELIGRSTDGQFPSGLSASSERGSTGNAGDLTISTQQLLVRNGAGVFVRSLGKGNAGNMKVTARSIKLDNQASLTASTTSSDGGNITFNILDYLLMRRNSNISASAGGNGGNILINNLPGYWGFVIAAPDENSDITANAFTGQGGKVDINSNGIFGFVPRSREDLERLRPNDLDPTNIPTNDITAISQQNPTLSGTVTLNTPDVDPSRGLIELPTNLVDASQQIAQGCTPRGRQNASRFISTGRGGLPLNPYEPLRGRAVITGWVDLSPQVTERVTDKLFPASVTKSTNQIVEAQGWIVDANGDVILVAKSGQNSSIPSGIPCNQ